MRFRMGNTDSEVKMFSTHKTTKLRQKLDKELWKNKLEDGRETGGEVGDSVW